MGFHLTPSRTNSTLSANPPSEPLSSLKRSPSMRTPRSNSRSGTLLDRSDTSLWHPCTTEMRTAQWSYTILHNPCALSLPSGPLRWSLTFIQASLDKAKAWVKELQRQANENIIIALAGNKLDLVTEQPDKRAIPTADAEAYAKEAGLLFFETSAKTAENVRELFTAIAKKLPLDQAGPRHARPGARPGVNLQPESGNTNASGQCSC